MAHQPTVFNWTVIGAGPSGIAAVGKLIDSGIPPKQIGWIDPHFKVGDFGAKWNRVPSNTSVELFLRFLNDCQAFELNTSSEKFALQELNPKDNCLLEQVVVPLQWISDHLKDKVSATATTAIALNLFNGKWEIKTKGNPIYAKNVILATGSEPKALSYPGPEVISLETALDPVQLSKNLHFNDTVAVFGSSHSAILVLANLHALKVKKVINFYRSPHRYAVHLKEWILFDDTGLKGFTAQWAKEHLDGTLPDNLSRVLISDHTFAESLALCNKVVYATGFQRRALPVLEQYAALHYDDKTGIIAPGLFGIGIAFPQAKFDPLGHLQHRVGLWKFMDYLNQILPIWIQYSNR